MKSEELIQKTTEELFKTLGVEVKIAVEEKEEVFQVQLETSDTGILIGYHGETLASLQLILSLMVYKALTRLSSGEGVPASKKTGNWLRLVVNVGDWRERREEILRQTALSAAERVINSGEPVSLASLSSFERRIIHMVLADHPQVSTLSEGEGEERRLIVRLRTAEEEKKTEEKT